MIPKEPSFRSVGKRGRLPTSLSGQARRIPV